MELQFANTELINRVLEPKQEVKRLGQESVAETNTGQRPVSGKTEISESDNGIESTGR